MKFNQNTNGPIRVWTVNEIIRGPTVLEYELWVKALGSLLEYEMWIKALGALLECEQWIKALGAPLEYEF